ncbi:hypothetical protein REPUB_Repub06bG0149600 [Reevesia pubescens]
MIFQHHENVVDVFIPVKRNKSGRMFGFVRFDNFSDARNVVEKLNGVSLTDFKLRVNFSRFKPISTFWRKVSSSSLIKQGKEIIQQNPRNVSDIPESSGLHNTTNELSYKEAVLKDFNVVEPSNTDSQL